MGLEEHFHDKVGPIRTWVFPLADLVEFFDETKMHFEDQNTAILQQPARYVSMKKVRLLFFLQTQH